MAHFWKFLLGSLATALLGYAAIVALTGLILPWRPTFFDGFVTLHDQPSWTNDTRYFMINESMLASPGQHVVIVGASTSRDPFRPEVMAPALNGWQVANASLSGAPVRQLADTIDMIYNEKKVSGPSKTVFVFCLTYLQVLPYSKGAPIENPLSLDAERMGMFARDASGRLVPQYPNAVEQMLALALRPQAIVASWPPRLFKWAFENDSFPVARRFADRLRAKDAGSQWVKYLGEHPDQDAVIIPPDMQRALLAQRLAGFDGDRPIGDEEIKRLGAVLRMIRAHGDGAVIVDLPLPNWHRVGAKQADHSFETGMRGLVAGFNGDPQVGYISLRDFDGDTNFIDSGHPKPRMWPLMSRALASRLLPYLRDDAAAPARPATR